MIAINTQRIRPYSLSCCMASWTKYNKKFIVPLILILNQYFRYTTNMHMLNVKVKEDNFTNFKLSVLSQCVIWQKTIVTKEGMKSIIMRVSITAHRFSAMHDILHSFPTYLIGIFTPCGFLNLQYKLKIFIFVLRFYQLNIPTTIIFHKIFYNWIVFPFLT